MHSNVSTYHDPSVIRQRGGKSDETLGDAATGDIVAVGPVLDRVEKRLENSRSFGRDIDELFKQLWQLMSGAWPTDPTESVEAACRVLRLCSLWQERVETPQRTISMPAEFALTRLVESLPLLGEPNMRTASAMGRAWHNCTIFDRHVFTTILLHKVPRSWFAEIEEAFGRERLRVQSAPGTIVHRGPAAALQLLAAGREHTLFVARLRAVQGHVDEAVHLLERETASDVRVIETSAAIFAEAGRYDEALDRLRRAHVVSSAPERVRERMLEICLQRGDIDAATELTLLLVEETRDILYWHVLSDYLAAHAPERLPGVREQLRSRSPSLHVEVLMTEGSHDAVAEAITSGKSFSFDQLWRAADFLAADRPDVASRVYERALLLQGAIAQTRGECAELANRMAAVGPFFEQLQRPTKLRRIATEIMTRAKTNVPLRRELERVFGNRF